MTTMARCARCSRPVAHPVTLGGMSFGKRCASIVRGPVARKRAAAAPAPDPRQPDLFGAEASA